jgi:hypothetical protein
MNNSIKLELPNVVWVRQFLRWAKAKGLPLPSSISFEGSALAEYRTQLDHLAIAVAFDPRISARQRHKFKGLVFQLQDGLQQTLNNIQRDADSAIEATGNYSAEVTRSIDMRIREKTHAAD